MSRSDLLTISALSIVAYVVQNVLHEVVGHAGVCLLLGGDPTAVSTAHFDMVDGSVGPVGRRLVAAGGTVVNLIAGGIFWVLLRRLRNAGGRLRYFLWISMTLNLLTGTGYFLFSGLTQFGDWVVVIEGLSPYWLWNTGLILIGVATYLLSVKLALEELLPFVADDERRHTRAFRLSFWPYLIGSTATTVGAVLNPVSPLLILTSAAANFGGTSGVAWMTQMYKGSLFKPSPDGPIEISRSWLWIMIAAILLALHVAVLGPSIVL